MERWDLPDVDGYFSFAYTPLTPLDYNGSLGICSKVEHNRRNLRR